MWGRGYPYEITPKKWAYFTYCMQQPQDQAGIFPQFFADFHTDPTACILCFNRKLPHSTAISQHQIRHAKAKWQLVAGFVFKFH